MKEGEGIRQRTHMHHPWTQTTVVMIRLARGGARAGVGWTKGEKMGASVIVSTIKIK